MISRLRLLTLSILVVEVYAATSGAVVVTIPDPNLEGVLRLTLGPYHSEPPYPPIEDFSMAALKGALLASNKGITDLTGLEYCVNLKTLYLDGNAITDLTPIGGLSNLLWLKCRQNPITDISPLAGLTSLELLWLGESSITDFSPIEGLINLTNLGLYKLDLSSIWFMSSLSDLTTLSAEQCQIVDLTPLQGLPALKELDLNLNEITVLTPLLANPNLGTNRTTVRLGNNPLTQFSVCTEVPELRNRGLYIDGVPACKGPIQFADPGLEAAIGQLVGITEREIYKDEVVGVGFTILNFTGVAVAGLAGLDSCTDLVELVLSNDAITDGAPLQTLTRLKRLHLDGNLIDSVSCLKLLTELEFLNLDSNKVANISDLAVLPRLYELSANNNLFTWLSQFGYLVHLNRLSLAGNQLVGNPPYDNDAFANLADLQMLDLRNNKIVDIAFLVGCPGLGSGDVVYLQGNPLGSSALTSDIPALQARGVTVYYDGQPPTPIVFQSHALEVAVRAAVGKPTGDLYDADVVGVGFTMLNAPSRQINSLVGIEHCTDLQVLNLENNQIQDLGPLAELSALRQLNLNGNGCADIYPLHTLTGLTKLSLADNRFTDLEPLTDLTHLTFLDLHTNGFTEVTALVENMGIGPGCTLDLRDLELSEEACQDVVKIRDRGADLVAGSVCIGEGESEGEGEGEGGGCLSGSGTIGANGPKSPRAHAGDMMVFATLMTLLLARKGARI